MSHTTTLKSLAIKDENAIVKAVEDLQKRGINCRLDRNTKPRMYYTRQEVDCDYVIRLDDSAKAAHGKPLDVGFQKQKDGTFAVIMDEWANGVGSQIGATCAIPQTAEERAMHTIGQFGQLYAKHAAINAATAQGYIVQRDYLDAEGNVQLEVVVA